MESSVNTQSHHDPNFWDIKRSPTIRFCHRASWGLILLTLVYSVVMYGTTTLWTQGPMVAMVALATLFWGLRVVLAREVDVAFSSLGAPLILVGTFVIVRYALTDAESLGRSTLLLALTAELFFFLVLNEVRHREQVTTIVWVITGLGAALTVYGLAQVLTGGRTVLGVPQYEAYWSFASGTFHRPADMAVFLHLAGAVAIANVFLSRHSLGARVGFALLTVVIIGGQLLTHSPVHWMGWGALLAVLGFFVARKQTWRFRWLVAGGCILVAVVIVGVFALESLRAPGPRTSSPTRMLWGSAVGVGQRNLLIGSGGGMFQWLYPARRTIQGVVERCPNQYLHTFAEYGLAGLALLLWMAVGFVVAMVQVILLRDEKYSLQRQSNRYAFAVAGVAAMAAGMVDAIFDLDLRAGGVLFPFLAVMAVALTCGIHRRVGEHWQERRGQFLTLRLHGASRFVFAIGLVGVVLFLASRLYRLYPAQMFLRRGQAALRELNWDGAKLSFERARRLDARNYEVAEALGDWYAAQATWNLQGRETLANSALIAYRRALVINPYAANIHIKIGLLCDVLGRRTEAHDAFHDAIDADRGNASFYVYYGQHFLRWGETAEAQRNFETARCLGAAEILPTDEAPPKDGNPG